MDQYELKIAREKYSFMLSVQHTLESTCKKHFSCKSISENLYICAIIFFIVFTIMYYLYLFYYHHNNHRNIVSCRFGAHLWQSCSNKEEEVSGRYHLPTERTRNTESTEILEPSSHKDWNISIHFISRVDFKNLQATGIWRYETCS